MSHAHHAPRRILMVVSNPATSGQTGWPIGFWWSELTHPYWEFAQRGFEITIASPDGGPVVGDAFSDPEHESGYSATDFVSLGFKHSASHAALLERTPRLADLDPAAFDATMFVGGQGPMYTFRGNPVVESAVRDSLAAGQPTALLCHATSVLLDATDREGRRITAGRRWTGFANAEEDYVESAVGRRIQPFRIEDEARKADGSNFVVGPAFAPFTVRDGNLVTGQQQNSGVAAAREIVAMLDAGARP